ncbi:hypothetical protein F2Q68_00030703 [Brassica cretica]|uniref:Uncharacterized protein n=1 Tax=Brassica cretica TaxID=69181 RepID=A0A8S9G346_BRACR|nr:hypothetical protein F2Q68_00030703 [Brassica cretica]
MPPHLDRNTTRGAHVLRSKLPHFTGMQITVPALIGHPPECDIIFRRSQRKSTTELHHESQPKPLKTIDLEPWIYASKSTSTICDRAKKKNPGISYRESIGQRKLIPETTRRESRRKNGAVRATTSREQKPAKPVMSTVSRRRKMETTV